MCAPSGRWRPFLANTYLLERYFRQTHAAPRWGARFASVFYLGLKPQAILLGPSGTIARAFSVKECSLSFYIEGMFYLEVMGAKSGIPLGIQEYSLGF